MPGTHPRGDRVQPRQVLSQLTGLFRDGRKMSRDHLRHAAAEGGCLCGALRYRIAPAAELCVYCCHCRDCQRLSSSAFTVSMVLPTADFTVVRGVAASILRRAESGRGIPGFFCDAFGPPHFDRFPVFSELMVVKAGTLTATTRFEPVSTYWS